MAVSKIIEAENLPSDIKEAAGADAPRTGLDSAVLTFKKSYVERVVQEVKGDLSAAAAQLEISLGYLYRLAKRLDIEVS